MAGEEEGVRLRGGIDLGKNICPRLVWRGIFICKKKKCGETERPCLGGAQRVAPLQGEGEEFEIAFAG